MHAQETSCSKMWRISLTVAVAAMAFAALAAVPEAFAKDNDKDQKGAELGPGCAPDRPAIAHHAGGILAGTDKVEEAPIPCTTATGFRTNEVSVVITNEGSALFQPAFPAPACRGVAF
jgi:hypothetical protein